MRMLRQIYLPPGRTLELGLDQRRKRRKPTSTPTVNTGVTVVVPDSNSALDAVVNGGFFFAKRQRGEMTGTHLIEESGILQGPIILTNTASLGTVRSYIIQYGLSQKVSGYLLPVVAETDDSLLNNINNNSITQEMVVSAYTESAAAASIEASRQARWAGYRPHRYEHARRLRRTLYRVFYHIHVHVLTSSNRGLAYIDNGAMDPLFPATVQATEMAIMRTSRRDASDRPGQLHRHQAAHGQLAAAFNQYNPMTAIFLY